MRAYVNHGRWVVDCPACNDAAVPDGPGAVPCPGCGAILDAEWPSEIRLIEATLEARPKVNRNWVPGETVEDLLAENIAHGVDNP